MDTVDVVVVVLVIVDVMCSLLRTRCECLVVQIVIFRAFHPLTTVDVKTRTNF